MALQDREGESVGKENPHSFIGRNQCFEFLDSLKFLCVGACVCVSVCVCVYVVCVLCACVFVFQFTYAMCRSGSADGGGTPGERVETVFSGARLPCKFHKELLSMNVQAVIDCSPGQGDMLQACVDTRTPVLALVLTERHGELLEERLTHFVLEKFQEPGHTFHRADCKIVKKKASNAEEEEKEETANPKPPKTPKDPNAKPKPKPKKKSRKSGSSSSSEESSKEKKKKNKKKKENDDQEEKKPKKKKKRKSESSEEELW